MQLIACATGVLVEQGSARGLFTNITRKFHRRPKVAYWSAGQVKIGFKIILRVVVELTAELDTRCKIPQPVANDSMAKKQRKYIKKQKWDGNFTAISGPL